MLCRVLGPHVECGCQVLTVALTDPPLATLSLRLQDSRAPVMSSISAKVGLRPVNATGGEVNRTRSRYGWQ